MLRISRRNNPQFALIFHNFIGPTIHIAPIIAPCIVENAVVINARDSEQTVFRGGVLLVAEEGNHVGFVGTEIHIFHAALPYHVVHKLDN